MSCARLPDHGQLLTEAVQDAREGRQQPAGSDHRASTPSPASRVTPGDASAPSASTTAQEAAYPDSADAPADALLLRRLSARGVELWLAAVLAAYVQSSGKQVGARGMATAIALAAHCRSLQYGAFLYGETLVKRIGWHESSLSRGLKALRDAGLVTDGFHRQEDGEVRVVHLFRFDEKSLDPKDREQLCNDRTWPREWPSAIYAGKIKLHRQRLSSADRSKAIAATAINQELNEQNRLPQRQSADGDVIAVAAIDTELPPRQSEMDQNLGNMRVPADQTVQKRLPPRQAYEERDKESYDKKERESYDSLGAGTFDRNLLPAVAGLLPAVAATKFVSAGNKIETPSPEVTSAGSLAPAPCPPLPESGEITLMGSDTYPWSADPAFAEIVTSSWARMDREGKTRTPINSIWEWWACRSPTEREALLSWFRTDHASAARARADLETTEAP